MPASFAAFLVVGVGGAAGAIARYALTVATLRWSASIPAGTFASNLLGCLLMGGLVALLPRFAWLGESDAVTDHYRLLFGVGFCGAFTTLSALVLELNAMLQRDEFLLAFAYLVTTLVGGFAAFWAGAALARAM
ncbi:MAG: fluoride efflux transporter CrcB [Woeseiaceae bacterium]|nr:fluoride efflux transporter CrcB [Woeseiaceae bacterium]